jgi:hypothetical protein
MDNHPSRLSLELPDSRHPPQAKFAAGTPLTEELLFELVIEVSYWSRTPHPDGMCVARLVLYRGQMALHQETGQNFALDRLVPPALREANRASPLQLAMAIARRFHGSYFWAAIHLLQPDPAMDLVCACTGARMQNGAPDLQNLEPEPNNNTE